MIDWDRIAELQVEVGEDAFAEVLEMFFEEVDEAMSGLADAEGADLAGRLHFLKGAALNIGMATLSDEYQSAEAALKSDSAAPINVDHLKTTLALSRKELSEMMG